MVMLSDGMYKSQCLELISRFRCISTCVILECNELFNQALVFLRREAVRWRFFFCSIDRYSWSLSIRRSAGNQ